MKRSILAVMVALTVGLIACSKEKTGIVIGVAGPMTGSEAVFGEQFVHGAKKAVADINAKGGVLGKQLELVMGDDACDPKQAVSVANDMASKGAVFVAGHYCSGSSIPASDVYAESNIVQISPASTNPDFTERKLPNVFRVCGRDDAQGPTAAEYVSAHFAGKRIAVVDDKSTYGKGLADQFAKALNAKGTQEVLHESISAGEKDYSPLVAKLKQAKADVVYFGGYKTEGGLIVRQMREQGLATVLIGGDALVTDEFWSITGPAGEGTLMTFGPDPRLNPENAALVASFRADNYEPEAYTLYTYAAIQAWAQAAEKAGTTDAAKVEAVLKSEHFDTVLGKVGFDAKGDMDAPGYVFYVWKNGKYAYADK
ncbi:branched-chain amino acid ABC transporter substrate-binding protein [Parvibaculum sp.]|uniref:branched-chain amino acid ABC transporter substrate-binding protein n=1 Tax=Parvibaculum sp. TaxID=2024848 RepID=UPI0038621D2B